MACYKLNAEITGSGPPVVLLHGLVSSHRYWERTRRLLQDRYQVIAFDLLGFGKSPKPHESAYRLEDQISSLTFSLQERGIRKPIRLVGHSMGALIALGWAAQEPDLFTRLVLVNLPLYTTRAEARAQIKQANMAPELMIYGPWARSLCEIMCLFRPLARLLAPLFLRDVPWYVAVDVPLHTWPSYSRSLANVIETQQVCERLGQVRASVCVLYGDQDQVVSSGNMHLIQECGTNIQLEVMRGTHHLPLTQPEAVVAAIIRA